MSLLGKSLEAITIEDIEALKNQKVIENSRLEYKSQPYEKTEDASREMLRDISAMANAEGGYLLLGISEDDQGAALNLIGIENGEEEKDRIIQIVLSCVDPRLALESKCIALPNGKSVLAIHIPASYKAPHMITQKGLNQFWKRHDRQKSKMSVEEIKESVIKTESFISNTKTFFGERRADAIEEANGRPFYLLGALPLSTRKEIVDPKDEKIKSILSAPPYVRSHGWYHGFSGYGEVRPSMNGLRATLPTVADYRSIELFRNGYLEARIPLRDDADFLENGAPIKSISSTEGAKVLHPLMLTEYALTFFMLLNRIKENYGFDDAYISFISLFNIEGVGLVEHFSMSRIYMRDPIKWKKKNLEIAPLQIDLRQSSEDIAKQFSDRLWQAFGFNENTVIRSGKFQFS